MAAALDQHLGKLRCAECGGGLSAEHAGACCERCGAFYPMTDGTLRMLRPSGEPRRFGARDHQDVKARTAASFAYEWSWFGGSRSEWHKNFLDYMQPHAPEAFSDRSVLDVGTGSGRHSREAALLGADVVAVDIGESIDVARRNLPDNVLTVQADAEKLPFAPESFDFVMSIGVLHHLEDTVGVLRALGRYVRPGGHLHVYLYWQPPHASHRLVLRGVSAARALTTKLPHPLLHVLCYPLAAILFAFVVLPYRWLRRFPRLRSLAELFPLKTYADYPFGVLVNDQFDRFSAPIEHRFGPGEVRAMLEDAGLEEISVIAHHGWIGDGRKPAQAQDPTTGPHRAKPLTA